MTGRSLTHLSLDDLDAWLAGQLGPTGHAHLDGCAECRELANTERILVNHLAALQVLAPAPGFADRVMASVAIPDPFALRSMESARRRLFTSRRSVAIAAMLALAVAASMAASVVWSLGHRQMIAELGSWISGSAADWAWIGLRGAVSSVMEQPWYGGLRGLAGSPAQIAVASAVASLTYLSGVLALRKLMTLPTGPVSHASA